MRIALYVALGVLGAALAGCAWLAAAFPGEHSFWPGDRTTFLFAGAGASGWFRYLLLVASLAVTAATIAALTLLSRVTSKIFRIVARVCLVVVLVVGIPIGGFVFMFFATTGSGVYTEVQGATLHRQLVVREWSFLLGGGGDVYERDGSTLRLIATTGADDGYSPFAAGNYTASEVGGVVTLEWAFASDVPAYVIIGALGEADTYDGLYHFATAQ
jgi:hypothetical protein